MLTDILSPTALLLAQGVCAEDICVLAFTSRPNDSIRTSTIGSRSGTDRRGLVLASHTSQPRLLHAVGLPRLSRVASL